MGNIYRPWWYMHTSHIVGQTAVGVASAMAVEPVCGESFHMIDIDKELEIKGDEVAGQDVPGCDGGIATPSPEPLDAPRALGGSGKWGGRSSARATLNPC
jgi:hypothetical protein